MHRVTGVEKKWQKKLKRDCPKTHQKNTSAALVKLWMQPRQVSKLQNDDRPIQEHLLWRMQEAQMLDSHNSGGCAPELLTMMAVSQNSERR